MMFLVSFGLVSGCTRPKPGAVPPHSSKKKAYSRPLQLFQDVDLLDTRPSQNGIIQAFEDFKIKFQN